MYVHIHIDFIFGWMDGGGNKTEREEEGMREKGRKEGSKMEKRCTIISYRASDRFGVILQINAHDTKGRVRYSYLAYVRAERAK